MRIRFSILAALGFLLTLPFFPCPAATAEPTSSAWQWLMLLDSGQYAESYAEASTHFRARITEKGWESKTELFRDAVGTIVWRDVLAVSTANTLPKMPEGQYALVRYRSQFQNKKDCEETVGLALENGLWRVATYSIK